MKRAFARATGRRPLCEPPLPERESFVMLSQPEEGVKPSLAPQPILLQ